MFSALAVGVAMPVGAFAQTDPVPQSLPYSQNFSGLAHTETTYPPGWQGWRIGTPSTAYLTTSATADQPLIPSSDASNGTGGVHNYNGRIGFLDSEADDNCIVLSVDATNWVSLLVSFDCTTVRAVASPSKTLGLFQYRVGTSGSWSATVPIINVTTSGVTGAASVGITNKTVPAAANNQPVVQIRWVDRGIPGPDGASSSWAVDNVTVTGTPSAPVPTLSTTWGRVKSLYR